MNNKDKPKIVFIGIYSDPAAPGGNNLLWKQAKVLLDLGYEVEIITWPRENFWKGKYPKRVNETFGKIPYLRYKRGSITYHIISAPELWGNDVPKETDWNESISWAKGLLFKIKPDIIHQHFWKKMWFFMEAAVQLNIPLIYSVYDWGLPCRRQVLIMGNGDLCHLNPSYENCKVCCADQINVKNPYSIINEPLIDPMEIDLLFIRWNRLSKKLAGLIVTSPFARNFYQSQGIDKKIIHEMPWFYGQRLKKKNQLRERIKAEPLTLGFLGRIVTEKGLHILMQALNKIDDRKHFSLEIAGAINSKYSNDLKEEFEHNVGHHRVNWLGWISNEKLGQFFDKIDILIVPSIWFDNSPTVIVEALAHNCPVICSDIPSMTHLISHNENGLVFELNNASALATQIERFAGDSDLRDKLKKNARFNISSEDYCLFLTSIYKLILGT